MSRLPSHNRNRSESGNGPSLFRRSGFVRQVMLPKAVAAIDRGVIRLVLLGLGDPTRLHEVSFSFTKRWAAAGGVNASFD